MMILTELYPNVLVINHPYLFLFVCAAITCIIAWMYKWIRISIM